MATRRREPTRWRRLPVDTLDNTSSRWFDTFCSAISTAGSTRPALNSVNAGDAA